MALSLLKSAQLIEMQLLNPSCGSRGHKTEAGIATANVCTTQFHSVHADKLTMTLVWDNQNKFEQGYRFVYINFMEG